MQLKTYLSSSDIFNLMSASSQSNQLTPHPMNVLLVEDSKLIRDTLISMLSNTQSLAIKGVADTQHRAIELLDKQQFDMLLVDIELAEGNGFEVIKYALENMQTEKPPVLMMLTNHAHPQYRRFAKHLGVKYFFDKSLDFDLAIETIEQEAEQFCSASDTNGTTGTDQDNTSLSQQANGRNKPH